MLFHKKQRLQHNQKNPAQLRVGPISIAGLALEPHAPCRVELETLSLAASEPCGLMHGGGRHLERQMLLSDMLLRHGFSDLGTLHKQLEASPAHAMIKQKTA